MQASLQICINSDCRFENLISRNSHVCLCRSDLPTNLPCTYIFPYKPPTNLLKKIWWTVSYFPSNFFLLCNSWTIFLFLFLSKLSLLQWGWIIFFSLLSCLQLLSLLEWADCFFSFHVFFSTCPAVWPHASIVMLPLKTYYSTILEEYNHSAQQKIPLQSKYSTVLLHKSKVLEVGFTCLTKSFYRNFIVRVKSSGIAENITRSFLLVLYCANTSASHVPAANYTVATSHISHIDKIQKLPSSIKEKM